MTIKLVDHARVARDDANAMKKLYSEKEKNARLKYFNDQFKELTDENSVSEPSEDDTLPVCWRNVKITSKTNGMCGLSDETTEIDLCSIQCFNEYMQHLFDL